MRVVHFSNFAPNRSGLYECTKDQIKYERKLGLDSQIAIFEQNDVTGLKDDWLTPINWKDASKADLFILHRGIPAELEKLNIPVVCVIHGTVEFLMLEEVISRAEKNTFNTHINLIRNSTAAVAMNQHDFDIYKLYDPSNKLSLIHDSIDTEEYTIEGHQYPYKNHPQILFADSLRNNKHPAHIIWAMSEVIKKIPNAKLTVVGLDLNSILTWRNLLLRCPNQHLNNNIENIQFVTNDNISYMRGADILFNSNISGVPSRTELEAMSCGCQVISYSGDFTKYHPSPFDIKDIAEKISQCWNDIKDNPNRRQEARQWVLDNASMEKNVKDYYIPLYTKILKEKK